MFKSKGFSLIELMIAVLVLAILMLAASVIYTTQARGAKRADGINTITSISVAEERYRSYNTGYGTLAQVWNGTSTSPGGFYTIAITNVGTNTYTITATGVGDQANDVQGGTACSPLVLTVNNATGTQTQTPAVCWPT